MTTWNDFYNEGLGPQLPLTSGQRQVPISGVLPSGEGGGFDYGQDRLHRVESSSSIGSGINVPFPYPNQSTADKFKLTGEYSDEWWDASGILVTSGPDEGELYDSEKESTIFSPLGDDSPFSNLKDAQVIQIEDFTIFNDYIHHERMPSNVTDREVIQIPYISTYNVAIDFRPYY